MRSQIARTGMNNGFCAYVGLNASDSCIAALLFYMVPAPRA
jgi:hypothetical protein